MFKIDRRESLGGGRVQEREREREREIEKERKRIKERGGREIKKSKRTRVK
jgi:hypothetical protein